MAKILTKDELKQVITELIDGDFIGDQHTYRDFLTELATAITTGMGGEVGTVDYVEDPVDDAGTPIGWTIAFRQSRWDIEQGETPPLAELLKDYDPEGEL